MRHCPSKKGKMVDAFLSTEEDNNLEGLQPYNKDSEPKKELTPTHGHRLTVRHMTSQASWLNFEQELVQLSLSSHADHNF